MTWVLRIILRVLEAFAATKAREAVDTAERATDAADSVRTRDDALDVLRTRKR